MNKYIIFVFSILCNLCLFAEEPQVLLDQAVVLMTPDPHPDPEAATSGPSKYQEAVQKLRELISSYPQAPQAFDAKALLALCLTQTLGDHADEVNALCDEVSAKDSKSSQAWLANLARVTISGATSGRRDGENQKTLDAALVAFSQTDGVALSRNPNTILMLKPLMDHWPPKPNDFTDPINSIIVEKALILGKYELSQEHLNKIVNQQLKERGDKDTVLYLRDHPEESVNQPRENKSARGTVNDSNSSPNSPGSNVPQQITKLASGEPSWLSSNRFVPTIIGLIIIGGSILYFCLRIKRISKI
jgi:hypothetical protein